MGKRKSPDIPERPCVDCEIIYKPINHNARYCSSCKTVREKAHVTRWHKNNRERLLEKKRKHYYENRDTPEFKANKAASQKLREQKKRDAVPAWYDSDEVKYIYSLATERNLHVDHIVPLNHELVCGLHVQDNLRCIPAELNRHKGNRYWPDMPVGG